MEERAPSHALFRLGMLLAGAIAGLDQISKYIIVELIELPLRGGIPVLPFLDFTMVWNRGISMNIPLGSWLGRWGIVVLTGLIIIWLVRWLWLARAKAEVYALSLIIGGAVGNLIDRFHYGAVADFIHLHFLDYNFYVFNIADAAITLGVVILIYDGLLSRRNGPKNDALKNNTD